MFLRIARVVPGLGIVFAALVGVAVILASGSPGTTDSDQSWTRYYADSGNRTKEEISFVLIGIAALCFLQFLGSVRGALARAEGEPARISTAAAASGTAFITLAVAAHAAGTLLSFTRSDVGSSYTIDPDLGRTLSDLSYLLFVLSLFAAAGMALAVATIAFQFKTLPGWLAWFSVLATIAGLVGIFFVPSVVVLVWIIALSAYLVVAANRPAPAPA
jgi:hypothetical protein